MFVILGASRVKQATARFHLARRRGSTARPLQNFRGLVRSEAPFRATRAEAGVIEVSADARPPD